MYFIPFFSLFVFLIPSFFPLALATADTFVGVSPKTEIFIFSSQKLATGQYRFFGRILSGDFQGRTGWFLYNEDTPYFRLYSNRAETDRLATPTTNIAKAVYAYSMVNTGFTPDAEEEKKQQARRKIWEDSLFQGLDKYVPISNKSVKRQSTDDNIACPSHPQQKSSKPCHRFKGAHDLAPLHKKYIIEAIEKIEQRHVKIDPALVAAILHAETQINPFFENEHEKEICQKSKNCSAYRWGKGLPQLGASDAKKYGLDWFTAVDRPRECDNWRSQACLSKLATLCEPYRNKKLRPINCAEFAIEAVVTKIANLYPSQKNVFVRQPGKTKNKPFLKKINIVPALTKDPVHRLRSYAGAYNRRDARVYNSYIEYFESHGHFPKDYGSAWATTKPDFTPSKNIGYKNLHREFINRCYVWNIAGLCGELPNASLVAQYREQFRSREPDAE